MTEEPPDVECENNENIGNSVFGPDHPGAVMSSYADADAMQETNVFASSSLGEDIAMDISTPEQTIAIEAPSYNIGPRQQTMPSSINIEEEYVSSSDESYDEDEWFVHTVVFEDIREKFNNRSKVASKLFKLSNGWPFRLVVYLNGILNGLNRWVSVFLEMADVDNPDIRLPATRRFDLSLDIHVPSRDGALFTKVWKSLKEAELSNGASSTASPLKWPDNFNWSSKDNFVHAKERKDCGYDQLISRSIFERYCISEDNKATFTVRLRARDFDAKANTGMVGLLNQGATCYLNSLLQTLYHTRSLRRAVYELDTSSDKAEQGVALELQRLFANLQTKLTAVSTQNLTKAFGWTDSQVFTQHDVQELLRELLDKLGERMKGTPEENVIKDLFCGQYATYIRCINVDCERSREEDFFDLQLDVRGSRGVFDSFRKYVQEERLEGDNQYDAEGFGKQDAIKGVRFIKFPPVLHLHLKRFAYNYDEERTFKIHDRFEFPEILDLSEFMPADQREEDFRYRLHSVLVHSGNDQRGHYYAFVYLDVNNNKQFRWYKFNDETVTRVGRREATKNTFGSGQTHITPSSIPPLTAGSTSSSSLEYNNNDGAHTGNGGYHGTSNGGTSYGGGGMYASAAYQHSKRFKSGANRLDSNASAYMLVYVREKLWDKVMQPVEEVPPELLERFEKAAKAKEEERARLERLRYLGKVQVATIDDIRSFNKYAPTKKGENDDWVDWDQVKSIEYGDVRDATYADLYKACRREFPDLVEGRFRLWSTCMRMNDTMRLDELIKNTSDKIAQNDFNKRIYLEVAEGDSFPPFIHKEISLLFKEYDPALPGMVVGSGKLVTNSNLFSAKSSLCDLWECLATKVLGSDDVEQVVDDYQLFELVSTNMAEQHNVKTIPYNPEYVISANDGEGIYLLETSGDIVIYSRRNRTGKPCKQYFNELIHSMPFVCRSLYSKHSQARLSESYTHEDDPEAFTVVALESSLVANELLSGIAKHLNCDPDNLQLTIADSSGRPERWPMNDQEYGGSCGKLFDKKGKRGPQNHFIFYEVLPITREDLATKVQLRILCFVPSASRLSNDVVLQNGSSPKKFVNQNLSVRWDQPRVEQLFVSTSMLNCAYLLDELARLLQIDGEREEVVLYIVSQPGRIERVITRQTLFEDSTMSRCSSHGVALIGDDGRAIVPDNRDPPRMVAEVIQRPPSGVRSCFKLAVQHCTLRDETAFPYELGLPAIAPVFENDSLGDFWRRLMHRLNVPSEVSANWRPVLGTKATVTSKIAYLDVRTKPNENGEDSQSGSLVGGQEIAIASALTNSIRSKMPKVPQAEYDSLPFWTRSEIQNLLKDDVLNATDSSSDEDVGESSVNLGFVGTLTFYIRHPNSHSSAPARTSTPVHSLTIRAS